MRKRQLLLAMLAATHCQSFAQEIETGFLDRSLHADGMTRHYQVFVPRAYDSGTKWPVILFLHGSRQVGNDGYKPTGDGIGSAIRQAADRFPAIVVFPQAREDLQWVASEADFALQTLDATESEFNIDADRVYLTGLSRGGRGAYYVAYRNVDRFAAVLAICGHVDDFDGRLPPLVPVAAGDPWVALATRLSKTPVWIYHGDSDPIIPVEQSRRLVSALKAVNAPVRYTELAGVGHNSWDAAYESEEAMEWLLANRREGGAVVEQ
ncbi:MAG: alpha/beta hydrolase-fold protein [Pseudomonadota bacterium]